MYTYTQFVVYMYTHTHTYIHTCIHTHTNCAHMSFQPLEPGTLYLILFYMCVHVHIHTHKHIVCHRCLSHRASAGLGFLSRGKYKQWRFGK